MDGSETIKEVMNAETKFMQMIMGMANAEGFTFFTDNSAVILRDGDSLLKGKEVIRHYCSKLVFANAKVIRKPNFVEMSDCGTLAYAYGKFVVREPN